MKNWNSYLILVLFVSFTIKGFCWGKEGHHITGSIALNYLDQKVKDSIQVYLGGTTLQEATTWMDDVRSDPSFDYMRTFHYINIEKGGTYDPSSQGNILSELNKVIEELKNRHKLSKEQIAIDLKILCHLIGDLHMPLHVGYAVDRGGNSVQVNFLGTKSNLHKVWDTQIITQFSIATTDCQKTLTGYSTQDLNKLRKVDLVAWLNESRANIPSVYDFKNPDIGKAYCEKNKLIIEKELGLAGLRLAQILNDIFAKL